MALEGLLELAQPRVVLRALALEGKLLVQAVAQMQGQQELLLVLQVLV